MARPRTLDLCMLAAQRPTLVLNGIRPGSVRATADAREALADREADIAPFALHDRAAYRAASINTTTAQEVDAESAASLEIGQLYDWVSRQVGLATKRQKAAVRA